LEIIVAVAVASPCRLAEVRELCDDVVCLVAPPKFWAISQFYEDFSEVNDAQAVEALRAFAPKSE
jgi:predicted phosphoribosyltransferase